MGKSNELLHADNNAHRLPEGCTSVKGLGSTAPNAEFAVTLYVQKIDFIFQFLILFSIRNDGVIVPMGPIESTNVVNPKGYTLNYNEYIVYDSKQVRMRYLLKLKFLFQ